MLLGINQESVPETHQFVKRTNVDAFDNFLGSLFGLFFTAALLFFPLFLLLLLVELLFVVIVFLLFIGLHLFDVIVPFYFLLLVRVLDARIAVTV
jgi:hypothetical protein